MRVKLIRHATLLVKLAGDDYLVDPMLSPAAAWDAVRNSANPRRNPMVALPVNEVELDLLLRGLSGVFVTHTHADHWDQLAKERLAKDLPVFCQPHDAGAIREAGFTEAIPVDSRAEWDGLQIELTGGRHGTGEVAERIGPVSGFVVRAPGEPSLYVAGDTVWCPEVAQALAALQPEVVVVNAGAAQFIDSGPITMDVSDVVLVTRAASRARVVAVHMEAINHCQLTRSQLREAMQQEGLSDRVLIPDDGQELVF